MHDQASCQQATQNGIGESTFSIPLAWNLLLCVLCLCVFIRVLPHLTANRAVQPAEISVERKSPRFTINVNTATLAELRALPDIGHSLAQRIVEYREANRGFVSLEELQNVYGFGPKRLSNLRRLISIGDTEHTARFPAD